MRAHHVLLIDRFQTPDGSDPHSWFDYYKWQEELGEVFVPLHEGVALTPPPPEWREGEDILWFVRASEDTFEVAGAVPLLRDVEGINVVELWFDSAARLLPTTPLRVSAYGIEKGGVALQQAVFEGMWNDLVQPPPSA